LKPWFRVSGWRAPKQEKPGAPIKIGVALGGGFARGVAHIGVLEVLERERIPIELLAGTSSGSVIAAGYASGVTLADMARVAGKLRMRDLSRWTVSRLGLSTNACMDVFLRRFLRCTSFEEMRIPLLVTATEYDTGRLVVFRDGSVCDAVRASCAYPLIFEPVKVEGHYYLDGGLVCGVPAQPLRDSGATHVIAVELTPHWAGGAPRNMLEILGQAVSIAIMSQANSWREVSDVIIQPDVKRIPYDGFAFAEELISAGREAAETALPKIKAWLAPHPGATLEPMPVTAG
jgi:NTE family protein